MLRSARVVVSAVVVWCLFDAPAGAREGASVAYKQVEGVKVVVPPREHPRLYLRAAHLADLRRRLGDPALGACVDRMKRLVKDSPQHAIEWDALQCLANGDRARGADVAARALEFLAKSELPDKQDACRVTGRAMVTGAIAYDWLYPVLTEVQKKSYIAELVRLAGTLECGYPPTRQGSVTGHSSEAMIMRDMLSAGIAIYDEAPEMYDHAARRFFGEHLPARSWLYAGHAYHQGDSYGPHRFSWDLFPLFIYDRMGAGNVYDPGQRYVPYLWLYTTRPDGQRLRAGDTFAHSAPRGRPWGLNGAAMLTASYYRDGYLLGEPLAHDNVADGDRLFELLWRDTSVQPRPVSELPLSRYFGAPFGWMVARTGWGSDAVVVEMKVNEYNFCNHQHLDAGAFQIYYRGPLAIDSGLYQGTSGGYGSPHCTNYYWRTIAHNCLLIHDPAEKTRGGEYANDAGQRLPNDRREPSTLQVLLDARNGYRTGEVVAHGCGPDERVPAFTYLKGNVTAAYSAKAKLVERSFVFFNTKNARVPGVLVVFDRVVSADPAFEKSWLLHCMEEPTVSADGVVVDRTEYGEQGRLILTPLIPEDENRIVTAVGGAGREFVVSGTNYPNQPAGDRRGRSEELGAWRVEIAPKKPSASDAYLNVMQITDRASDARLSVERIQTGACIGCRAGEFVALFSRSGTPHRGEVAIELAGAGRRAVVVADLAPGTWRLRAGRAASRELATLEGEGAVYFEGAAGTYTLSR